MPGGTRYEGQETWNVKHWQILLHVIRASYIHDSNANIPHRRRFNTLFMFVYDYILRLRFPKRG